MTKKNIDDYHKRKKDVEHHDFSEGKLSSHIRGPSIIRESMRYKNRKGSPKKILTQELVTSCSNIILSLSNKHSVNN